MESREIRRRTMQAVKGKNTRPELVVRSLVHSMGFRFRLHRKDLPGNPDVVFSRLRKVIFVHGCFWHGHDCARGARVPKTNRDYWDQKIGGNRRRDRRSLAELKALGWQAKVFWECQLKDQQRLRKWLRNFLVKL